MAPKKKKNFDFDAEFMADEEEAQQEAPADAQPAAGGCQGGLGAPGREGARLQGRACGAPGGCEAPRPPPASRAGGGAPSRGGRTVPARSFRGGHSGTAECGTHRASACRPAAAAKKKKDKKKGGKKGKAAAFDRCSAWGGRAALGAGQDAASALDLRGGERANCEQ